MKKLEWFLHEEQSYVKGYLTALDDFAVWKDGSQFVGCGVLSKWEAGFRFLQQYDITDEQRVETLVTFGFRRPLER